jgi:hypothetical protein
VTTAALPPLTSEEIRWPSSGHCLLSVGSGTCGLVEQMCQTQRVPKMAGECHCSMLRRRSWVSTGLIATERRFSTTPASSKISWRSWRRDQPHAPHHRRRAVRDRCRRAPLTPRHSNPHDLKRRLRQTPATHPSHDRASTSTTAAVNLLRSWWQPRASMKLFDLGGSARHRGRFQPKQLGVDTNSGHRYRDHDRRRKRESARSRVDQ